MHTPSASDPAPTDERQRQAALDRLQLLDTVPEQAYDDLTRLAAAVCRFPKPSWA